MEPFSWWENVLLGVMALLVVFTMQRSAKSAFERSKYVKADWMSVVAPLVLVTLFVVFLIKMV